MPQVKPIFYRALLLTGVNLLLRVVGTSFQVYLSRQIEARQQSPDHPILWNVPETDYLKFYLFQVV